MSLEQDLFYSNHVERRNVDYFILTRMRDTSCLQEFYKRYCRDIQQWRFIELYELSVEPALGYMIIDFVCPVIKYRINSLNTYYSIKHFKMRYILGKADDALTKLNIQLKTRFQSFLSKSKHKTEQSKQVVDSDDESIHSDEPSKKTTSLCQLNCLYCDLRGFLNDSMLAIHVKEAHSNVHDDKPTKLTIQSPRWNCIYCDARGFRDMDALTIHMDETHEDVIF